MLRTNPCSLLAAATLASVALTAQTTHVVTGGGANLQSAINSAVAGDTLDVMPGVYSPVTCSKGIRVLLQPGAEVGYGGGPLGMLVTALPAQQVCVVQGGLVYGLSVTQSQGAVIVEGTRINYINQLMPMLIGDCSGAVVFDEVDCSLTFGLAHFQMQIENCLQVSLHASRPMSTVVINSHVSFADSILTPYGFLPGLELVSGSVTVCGGRISGGVAASWPILESGIELLQGELTLTGGASIEASPAAISFPIPAITSAGGSIRLDPGVTLLGLPIAGPATVTLAPVPSLAVTHTATTMNVDVVAEPGSAVFTFGGLAQPAAPTPWGEAWLLPSDPILNVQVVPPSGAFAFARTFGAVPEHFVLVVQSVALTPAGALVVGAPVRFAWN